MSNTLECHSFSEPLASAGELLHTSEQVSTFMTTDLLTSASSILKLGPRSEHLDIQGTFSEHPASPVLLTSEGPHKAQATLRFFAVRIFALSNAEDLSPQGHEVRSKVGVHSQAPGYVSCTASGKEV